MWHRSGMFHGYNYCYTSDPESVLVLAGFLSCNAAAMKYVSNAHNKYTSKYLWFHYCPAH